MASILTKSVLPRWTGKYILAALLLAILFLFGPGYRVEWYSCHKCLNRNSVRTHTFLSIEVKRAETLHQEFIIEDGHIHK